MLKLPPTLPSEMTAQASARLPLMTRPSVAPRSPRAHHAASAEGSTSPRGPGGGPTTTDKGTYRRGGPASDVTPKYPPPHGSSSSLAQLLADDNASARTISTPSWPSGKPPARVDELALNTWVTTELSTVGGGASDGAS